jgi:molybdate transport system substrate-binding protein
MSASALAADSLTVAVTASFKRPFGEIARSFEAGHPIKVEASFASTGTLYSQIVNGAHYDILLAADDKRPQVLHDKALADPPVIYARGRVVLWTNRENLCRAGDWKSVLRDSGVQKIAIASSATSPYGAAAESALWKGGLWEAVKPRFVYAQDVGQAFQYVYAGAAATGFCALSDAVSVMGREGCSFEVGEAPPVQHSACVLKKAKNREAARLFIKFLQSPEAEKIKREYGYR